MRSILATRPMSAAILLAPLVLVTACAGKTAVVPDARAPVAPATEAPGVAAAQPKAGETSGIVAISDEIRKACGIADEDAYFAFDSARIESTDIGPLDAVAKCFSVGPLAGRGLRLVGHADPRGSSDYNLTLGQSRADSVERYLSRRGVSQSRVGTTSRGAMDATGSDEAGWTHDRRVDVMLGS